MERTKKGSLKKTVITGLALLAVIVMVSGEKPGRESRENGFFASQDDGRTLNAIGIEQRLIATRADTGGYFDVLEGVWAPEGVFGMHTHDYDEFYYIAEGDIIVDYGDRTVNASVGSFFFFPKGQAHLMKNPSSTVPLKVIIFFAPAFGDGYDKIMDGLEQMSTDDPDYGAKVGELMENTGKTHVIQ